MPRAFSKVEAAAILASNTQTVYDDLVCILSEERLEDRLLAIEFLGKTHELPTGANFLVDGYSVAIPKLKLIQAFVVARKVLSDYVRDPSIENQDHVRDATTIILLTDPEHLTAANTRKRLIRDAKDVARLVDLEFWFIDSLLSSPLNRHSKSPTLWNHRRWLVDRFRTVGDYGKLQIDLWKVIMPAAASHPRNYYAWDHARWLLNTSMDTLWKSQDPPGTPSRSEAIELVNAVKEWCLGNPSDISGWSFLSFCMGRLWTENSRLAMNSAVCKEVVERAILFSWTHESVWVFLRTLVASRGLLQEQQIAFFEGLERVLLGRQKLLDEYGCRILLNARDWCNKYQQCSATM